MSAPNTPNLELEKIRQRFDKARDAMDQENVRFQTQRAEWAKQEEAREREASRATTVGRLLGLTQMGAGLAMGPAGTPLAVKGAVNIGTEMMFPSRTMTEVGASAAGDLVEGPIDTRLAVKAGDTLKQMMTKRVGRAAAPSAVEASVELGGGMLSGEDRTTEAILRATLGTTMRAVPEGFQAMRGRQAKPSTFGKKFREYEELYGIDTSVAPKLEDAASPGFLRRMTGSLAKGAFKTDSANTLIASMQTSVGRLKQLGFYSWIPYHRSGGGIDFLADAGAEGFDVKTLKKRLIETYKGRIARAEGAAVEAIRKEHNEALAKKGIIPGSEASPILTPKGEPFRAGDPGIPQEVIDQAKYEARKSLGEPTLRVGDLANNPTLLAEIAYTDGKLDGWFIENLDTISAGLKTLDEKTQTQIRQAMFAKAVVEPSLVEVDSQVGRALGRDFQDLAALKETAQNGMKEPLEKYFAIDPRTFAERIKSMDNAVRAEIFGPELSGQFLRLADLLFEAAERSPSLKPKEGQAPILRYMENRFILELALKEGTTTEQIGRTGGSILAGSFLGGIIDSIIADSSGETLKALERAARGEYTNSAAGLKAFLSDTSRNGWWDRTEYTDRQGNVLYIEQAPYNPDDASAAEQVRALRTQQAQAQMQRIQPRPQGAQSLGGLFGR